MSTSPLREHGGSGAATPRQGQQVELEREASADSAAVTVQGVLAQVRELAAEMAQQRTLMQAALEGGRERMESVWARHAELLSSVEGMAAMFGDGPLSHAGSGQPTPEPPARDEPAEPEERAGAVGGAGIGADGEQEAVRAGQGAWQGRQRYPMPFLPKPKPPPPFGGNPRDYEGWKLRMEIYLQQFPQLPDNAKALMVGQNLDPDGAAGKAFLGLARDVGAAGLTYSGVMTFLDSRFASVTEAEDALRLMESATQGNRSVVAWEHRVRELASMRGMEAYLRDEQLLLRKFILGMRDELRAKMVGKQFATLAAASEEAQRQEQHLRQVGALPQGGRSQRFSARRKLAALLAALSTEDGSDATASDPSDDEGEEDADGGSDTSQFVAQLAAALQGRTQRFKKGGSAASTGGAGRDARPTGPVGKTDVVPGIDGKTLESVDCHYCHRYGHRKLHCPRRNRGKRKN